MIVKVLENCWVVERGREREGTFEKKWRAQKCDRRRRKHMNTYRQIREENRKTIRLIQIHARTLARTRNLFRFRRVTGTGATQYKTNTDTEYDCTKWIAHNWNKAIEMNGTLMEDFYWLISIGISQNCCFANLFLSSSNQKIFHDSVCVRVWVWVSSDCLKLTIWHVKRMCHVENIKCSSRKYGMCRMEWNCPVNIFVVLKLPAFSMFTLSVPPFYNFFSFFLVIQVDCERVSVSVCACIF